MVLTRETCDEMKSAINGILASSMKDPQFIKTITDKVVEAITRTINKRLLEFENKMAVLEEKMENMKTENENKTATMEMKLDFYNQHMKMNNLRLFNFAERDRENTRMDVVSFLNNKMSINLKDEDVEVCYRIGMRKDGNSKPRGIFLKLKTSSLKNDIYNNKKLLKGTGIIIREDLTPFRVKLLSRIIDKVSVRNVWTYNGQIYVNFNQKIHKITSDIDFQKTFT